MPWIETTSPKVFTGQPTPPYLTIDLWHQGDDIYKCTKARTSSEAFNASDWTVATPAEEAKSEAQAAITAAGEAKEIAEKTANHVFVDADGLHIASVENVATTGGNVLVSSDGLAIREGEAVSATFKGNAIELGLDAAESSISFCGGTGTIARADNGTLEVASPTGVNIVSRVGGDHTSLSVYPRESQLVGYYYNPIDGISRHTTSMMTKCRIFSAEAFFLVATEAGAENKAGFALESTEADASVKVYSKGNEGFLHDWVVQRYSSGMWEVEKWASGRMVIEGQKLVSGQATAAWGNGFVTSEFAMGSWPEPFVSTPMVSPLYNASGSGNYQLGNFPSMVGFPTTTACPGIRICTMRNTSPYDAGGYLGARAVGRWK